MKLIDLLNVLDVDSKIHIIHNYKEVYDGFSGGLVPAQFSFTILESKIKSVWYSGTMNRIVIEC